MSQILRKLIRENILTGRQEKGTSDCLKKDDNRGTNWDLGDIEDCLNGDEGLLYTETDADTCETLITNPSGEVSIWFEGG